MSCITYFPRYSTAENVVTNTTLHLFSQIDQHSTESLQAALSELLSDAEIPLGINFQQQTRSTSSVPDGSILQERIHIVIETKVTAGVDVGQLIRHCEIFEKGKKGNYLLLLTKDEVDKKILGPILIKAKEIGATFHNITFEKIRNSIIGIAKDHETHLKRVIDDYAAFCTDMNLLPDRRKWLRIVPCGTTFSLNEHWNCYYQPTGRSYSAHDYIGIYYNKAVRLVGRVAGLYDNKKSAAGQMELQFVADSGVDRPEFRQRIEGMVIDSKQKVGWDVSSDMRFFCVEKFQPTNFKKTSSGGIQGPRFWDISAQAKNEPNDSELAEILRKNTWE